MRGFRDLCPDGGDVSRTIYFGLEALQHRGQESCGIAVSNTNGPKGRVNSYRGLGLLNEVFKGDELQKLKGNIGVGHVRYSTSGALNVNNAQPLVLNYIKGSLALAHNGRGAYALVMMSPRKLIGVRDPWGLRPLCIGKRDNAYILASESCALHSIDADFIRDVKPGEIVTIDKNGELHSEFMDCVIPREKQARCIFEYIYFARLDSKIDGIAVYDARIRGGASLAKTYPVDADIVVGVPDSGLAAAQGYALESGIPFGIAFHKNSYVGRTFIKPSQDERESSVKIKLSVIKSVVKGKRVVLVDDSIVRGTTITNLIHTMKKCGATEVHVRISSPPFLHPCYFGVDVPSNKQLIASQNSTEEIRRRIGADSLGYMQISELQDMVGDLPICKACFDQSYPMEVPDHEIRDAFEGD